MKSQTANLFKIGHIVAPRGLKGELKIHLYAHEAPWKNHVSSLTLKKEDQILKSELEFVKEVPPQLIVKLKDVNDRTAAEKWVKAEVFILEELLESSLGENLYLREILGFTVIVEGEDVGVVKGFETNNSQDLLVVERPNQKDVLIPLIKEFLVSIDHEARKITMNIPPGLLEVNA